MISDPLRPVNQPPSMMNDIHVLGDHTTTATANLRTIENVANDYLKSLNRMLGNHNGITQQITADIKCIPKTITNQERAAKILADLRFPTVRLGTGDNRVNNLKRRVGHERRTIGFVQA